MDVYPLLMNELCLFFEAMKPSESSKRMNARAATACDVTESVLARGRVTRQELLAELDIRPATLFDLVRHLARKGFVEEPERKGARTGRRASPISVRHDYGLFVGIGLELTGIQGVCIDARGEVLASTFRKPPPGMNAAAAREAVVSVIAEIRRKLGARAKAIRGIGLDDPGVIDFETGTSVLAVNIPGWKNLATAKWLRELTGWTALLHSNSRTYAEAVIGNHPRTQGLFHLLLDDAVGGGFIRGGEIFRGDTGMAMEVGHLVVQPGGPLCRCGNRGCLEAFVGAAGMRHRVEDLHRNKVRTLLREEGFTLAHFVDCVRKRDRAAMALLREVTGHVGAMLATIVGILNPSTVVVTGALAGLGDQLFGPVRNILAVGCVPIALDHLTLRASTLPENATALGAAFVVRREVIRKEIARAFG